MTQHNCDTVLDYFNGHLPTAERAEFEKYLEDCQDCKELLAELNAIAGDLPFESEPLVPPTGMKDRILAKVFEEDEQSPTVLPFEVEEEVGPIPSDVPSMNREAKKKKSYMIPTLAAALFLSLVGNIYLFDKVDGGESSLATTSIDEVLEFVELKPVDGNAAGTASVVKAGDQLRLVVQASQLKELKEEEVYQVWLIENEKPVRAGSFVISDKGQGTVVFQIEKNDKQNWDTVAITLEPNVKSQTPKGNIVLASEL